MRIICPKCGTEYFLESEQLDQEGTPVQCSACEHTFTVYGPETPRKVERRTDPAATPPPPPPPPAPARPTPPPPARRPESRSAGGKAAPRKRGGALFLAQGDRIYKVKDAATLQRWIVEKRILPNDRVSSDGKSWEVVSSRPDLRPFFAIIEQLKSAKRNLRRAESHVTVAPVSSPSSPSVAASGDAPPVSVPPPPPPPPSPPPEAAASMPPDPSIAMKAAESGPQEVAPGGADSFWKMAEATDLPEALGEAEADVSSGGADKETRAVPVPSTRKVPVEASGTGQNEIRTSSGPTQAVSEEDVAGQSMPSPSSDFDPDQTFSDVDDTFEPRRGGGLFMPLVLLLLVGAAGAMWYFMLGPGRADVYSGDGVTDAATPEPTAEATPEAPPEPSPEPSLEPGAEPTPEATPTPKATPTPRATPSPKATPRPSATPKRNRPKPAANPPGKVDHMKVADAARGRGQFAKAVDAYAKALDADPSNFQAALQAGWMNIELGRNAAAVSAFKNSLKLRSTSAEGHYGLGLAYQARGQVQAAIAEYERVIELDPDGRDTREVKAILRQLKP